jgi:L-threonylcarbamoyladenylate synthase
VKAPDHKAALRSTRGGNVYGVLAPDSYSLILVINLTFAPVASAGTDITRASELILKGELVAIPTETVYGLAANALNEKAVLSIFVAKQRPFFDPLIVHVHSLEQAQQFATIHDERLMALARKYWPGPLTLLLPKKEKIPGIVTSGLTRVGIRVPSHPLTLRLLREANVPLAAPSANPFGYISPTLASHVEKQLGDKVSYILDGGNCSIGIESTIVGLESGVLCVYRLGGLAIEAIEKIAGKVVMKLTQNSDPSAPGQLSMHYSPRKILLLDDIDSKIKLYEGKKVALIAFGKNQERSEYSAVYNLSPSSDLSEAALNLFRMLREADESDADILVARSVPEEGLGLAINDRLRRAAAK